MSVVTISRGTLSGGLMIAESLSAKLGYRCIGRDVIVEKAALSGISQDLLRDVLDKPPSFLERFKHRKHIYLALIQAALSEEMRPGNVVYHGNVGHLLLKGAPVLRARIIAPMEFRLRMAQERLKLDRARALEHIQRMDHERKKWAQYIYGVDWTDPSLYDIVLNLESVSMQDACDILVELVTRDRFKLTPESQEALNDIALVSRIRANLAVNPSTEYIKVEVLARARSVTITGKFCSCHQYTEVERIAKAVPGAKEINIEALPI
jgi:cytidylate kinase